MSNSRKSSRSGQALVEFVILLIVIMTLIMGMIYFFRLHLYKFWAQQEARYIAFEQTWVPRAYYKAQGGSPESLILGQATGFVRPGEVSRLPVTRSHTSFGSMSDLIPGLFARLDAPLIERGDAESYLFVSTAYASRRDESNGSLSPVIKRKLEVPSSGLPALDVVLADRFQTGGFGEKFCSAGRDKLGEAARVTPPFSALDCEARVSRDLARTIVRQTDIKDLFREMADRVEGGAGPDAAIQATVSEAVASGFYTFFSDMVELSFSQAPGAMFLGTVDFGVNFINPGMARMLTELRYVGSTAAVLAIQGQGLAVAGRNYNNRSWRSEKTFEEGLQEILHIDAASILPVIGNGYLLNPLYLPVPPTFGPAAGGFFTGTMTAVLSLDAGDRKELIEESVRRVSVSYDYRDGVFSGARKRFRTDSRLSANFVIDTNPWHIERRVNGIGPYAEKGEEFDTVDDDTDEGRLRRRVNGMWLFPTPPDAFFDPLLSFVGLDELSSLVSAFRPVGDFISQIKSLLTNNPLLELSNTLSNLPVIGSIFPRFPVWPVVRPDAYPSSEEMSGDRKMGGVRNFNDYVDEQRDNNPPPRPKFND
jgi:hypothetical protein